VSDRLLRLVSLEDVTSNRRRAVDPATLNAAGAILDDIDLRGDSAVLEHAARLGDIGPGAAVLHDLSSLRAALNRISERDRLVLERTAARIRAFAEAQRSCLRDLDIGIEAGRAGHTCLPVWAAGCYAPGGRFPLPSSVLMTVVTARVAGVQQVWVASPRPADATLAAAAIAGADGLLAVGGVQAIAALADGRCGMPRCDIIVGPGNRWVTAAKLLVSDRVGIDMLAGPSELVVLADHTADPVLVAADLLAQAEHDDDAVPILVTTDPSLPDRVEAQLRQELESLPTRSSAAAALRNGFSAIAPAMAAAISACDRIAPEHVEVMTSDPEGVAEELRDAGAIFVGHATSEVFGDYGAGPNHVLPTGGTARFKAGLSVFTFLRPRTWLRTDGLNRNHSLRKDTAALARLERLEAHARASEFRA
jgi:phosphoribosyl-ATP pyrophosphohydrolase/phosphoribosyl-AMP cyclohydrolase/histidinol dehydrogenase